MATVELKPSALWGAIKGWVSWLAGEAVFLVGVVLAVVLALIVFRDLGFDVPFFSVPGSAASWVYAAGFYYLVRR